MPASDLGRERSPLPAGPYVPGLVLVYRRRAVEHGIDDRPLRLHAVLAGEQDRIARHRVAEQPLVRFHLLGRSWWTTAVRAGSQSISHLDA